MRDIVAPMNSITYPIDGMTCQKCVARVAAALTPLADSASVSLAPPQVTLENPKADFAQLSAAVAGAGHYTLLPQGQAAKGKSWLATYRPLLLVIGYIALASCVATNMHDWMHNFMGGFFLVFSFFKMLDLKGFADAYASYDLLAARSRAYGYIYPFIELGLGICYLFQIFMPPVHVLTLIVMIFSGIGVVRVLLKKQTIRCACLGTGFNLPMSTVTIIEDFGMAAMAVWMMI